MKTYWLLECKGRKSCKGEFEIPDMTQVANFSRRGSTVSRTYSPVTQRSLSPPYTEQLSLPSKYRHHDKGLTASYQSKIIEAANESPHRSRGNYT